MDFLSELWNMFIVDPWNYGDLMGKIVACLMAIVGLLLVGLIVSIIVAIISGIARKIHWVRNRKPCMHCGTNTLETGDSRYTNCMSGQPCCYGCTMRHKSDAEDKYRCPVDGHVMDKEIDQDLGHIIDVCQTCRHRLVSETELDAIRKASYDEGYSNGRSSGNSTGLVTGIALGSAIS